MTVVAVLASACGKKQGELPASRSNTPAGGGSIWVSPLGDDAGDGSKCHPLATLEKARLVARSAPKPVTIVLGGGDYFFAKPFELTEQDSGEPGAPVIWQAAVGQIPRLLGARKLSRNDFAPVTDAATLARISPAAKGKIVAIDMKSVGVRNAGPFPDVFNDGGGIAGLFFNGRRMPVSRYPNGDRVMRFKALVNLGAVQQEDGTVSNGDDAPPRGSAGETFGYREEFYGKHESWAKQIGRGIWLKGNWRGTSENSALRVGATDDVPHIVTFAQPIPIGTGTPDNPLPVSGHEGYWIINLLEEIDQPGEWAMDFSDHKIYFYPPGDLETSEVLLMDSREPVVSLKGTSHVTFRGLTVEAGLGDGFRVTGGENVDIAGCTVRWVNKFGIVLDGGKNHSATSNDLYHLGAGGIWLGGGDGLSSPRVPAGHRAVNNHIHHFAEMQSVDAPGINCGGSDRSPAVGMYVAHNLIHDSPYGGILCGGTDNVFEQNEIYRFDLLASDFGGFYICGGRGHLSGNITLRNNFVHSSGAGNGITVEGGRPNVHVSGNIVSLKSRGLGGTGYLFKVGTMANAGLAQAFDCVGNIAIDCQVGFEFASLLPHRGTISNNVAVQCKTPIEWSQSIGGQEGKCEPFANGKNAIYQEDPGFVMASMLDFRLKPDARLLQDLPTFPIIPLDQIGLQIDGFRKKLPSELELDRSGRLTSSGQGQCSDIPDRPPTPAPTASAP